MRQPVAVIDHLHIIYVLNFYSEKFDRKNQEGSACVRSLPASTPKFHFSLRPIFVNDLST